MKSTQNFTLATAQKNHSPMAKFSFKFYDTAIMTVVCLNFRMAAYFVETLLPCDVSKSLVGIVFVLWLQQVKNYSCLYLIFTN
jgi:hypothetical protein